MEIYEYTNDDMNRIYGKHRRYDVGTYLKSKDGKQQSKRATEFQSIKNKT